MMEKAEDLLRHCCSTVVDDFIVKNSNDFHVGGTTTTPTLWRKLLFVQVKASQERGLCTAAAKSKVN